MRNLIREQIQSGRSDEEIINFLEERYGEEILLKPKSTFSNLGLWLLPIIIILFIPVYILKRVKFKA
jgi:cytochrome c-type biogenesis protein CcmH